MGGFFCSGINCTGKITTASFDPHVEICATYVAEIIPFEGIVVDWDSKLSLQVFKKTENPLKCIVYL